MVGVKSISVESLDIISCSSVKYITIFLQSRTWLNATYSCPWVKGGDVMSRSNLNSVWDWLLFDVIAYARCNLSIFLVLLCCYVVGCTYLIYLPTCSCYIFVLLYCRVVILLCCCVVVLLCCRVVIMLSDVHTWSTRIYLRYTPMTLTHFTLTSRGLEELFFQLCCCVSFWFWREIGFGSTYLRTLLNIFFGTHSLRVGWRNFVSSCAVVSVFGSGLE